MVEVLTTRQPHRSSRIGKRSLSEITKMRLMIIIMTVSVLSTTTSTLAESETNDLNTLETPKQSKSKANITAQQTEPETRQYPYSGFMTPPLSVPPSFSGCPLCDSSVYSYCSHKLIHDSCCCDFPGSTIYQKPPHCFYFDCALLYAKSCNEHGLIKNCCCNNPY